MDLSLCNSLTSLSNDKGIGTLQIKKKEKVGDTSILTLDGVIWNGHNLVFLLLSELSSTGIDILYPIQHECALNII